MEEMKYVINKDDFVLALKSVGLKSGDIVEVHCSMKALGYVIGGAEIILQALIEVIGCEGTLVMPLQNGNNTEPANWMLPPVPFSSYEKIRESMPVFNPLTSDTRGMGELVAAMRRLPVSFSSHPNAAYMAYGKWQEYLMSEHQLEFCFGVNTPVEKLYALKARVLLLGVDYNRATALHYGEYLTGVRAITLEGSKTSDGKWTKYLDYEYDSEEFIEVGKLMERNNLVSVLNYNESTFKLFNLNDGIACAITYFNSLK